MLKLHDPDDLIEESNHTTLWHIVGKIGIVVFLVSIILGLLTILSL